MIVGWMNPVTVDDLHGFVYLSFIYGKTVKRVRLDGSDLTTIYGKLCYRSVCMGGSIAIHSVVLLTNVLF